MTVVTTTEMILAAVGTLGTGAIGGGAKWLASKVITQGEVSSEILSELRSIKQSLYGNPESKTPDGLQATLSATMAAVETVDGKIDGIDERVEKIDTRLTLVERGCLAQHGQGFFRLEPKTNE